MRRTDPPHQTPTSTPPDPTKPWRDPTKPEAWNRIQDIFAANVIERARKRKERPA